MSDSAPKLGDIPQHSDFSVPTLSSNTGSDTAPFRTSANGNTAINDSTYNKTSNGLAGAKDTVLSSVQSGLNSAANHPVTQNIKDTVNNAPVTEVAKDQAAKTSNEFSNLANARSTPKSTTANDQPLTHYHSFFYTLLSWENPRATAISFALTVFSIFAIRYLPALRWTFKVLYLVLGVTAAAELVGKTLLSQGLASSFRPRRYYTIPRETLEASLEDVEQLINFFVIEFQRILFAENVFNTTAAFFASVLGYWLIKFVPLWGLTLITVSTIYLAPLIYINNKEVIDQQIAHGQELLNAQTKQVKDIAGQQTARATSTIKGYTSEYSAKAQDLIGSARARSTSPEVGKKETAPPAYNDTVFPTAPKGELKSDIKKEFDSPQFAT